MPSHSLAAGMLQLKAVGKSALLGKIGFKSTLVLVVRHVWTANEVADPRYHYTLAKLGRKACNQLHTVAGSGASDHLLL